MRPVPCLHLIVPGGDDRPPYCASGRDFPKICQTCDWYDYDWIEGMSTPEIREAWRRTQYSGESR